MHSPPGIPAIPRRIDGFERDADGQWVALLDCLHRRHVIHRPPLSTYPWIDDDVARAARVGTAIECDRCAQRVWPEDLEAYSSTPVFDAASVPGSLLKTHDTKTGVWGELQLLEGTLELVFEPPLATRASLCAPTSAAIPPELPHHVVLGDGARFRVRFYRRPRHQRNNAAY